MLNFVWVNFLKFIKKQEYNKRNGDPENGEAPKNFNLCASLEAMVQ